MNTFFDIFKSKVESHLNRGFIDEINYFVAIPLWLKIHDELSTELRKEIFIELDLQLENELNRELSTTII